jgi:hypothetical protein
VYVTDRRIRPKGHPDRRMKSQDRQVGAVGTCIFSIVNLFLLSCTSRLLNLKSSCRSVACFSTEEHIYPGIIYPDVASSFLHQSLAPSFSSVAHNTSKRSSERHEKLQARVIDHVRHHSSDHAVPGHPLAGQWRTTTASSRIPSTTTATTTTSRIQASQDQDHRRSVADFHMRPDHLRRLHQRLRAMVWWLLQ